MSARASPELPEIELAPGSRLIADLHLEPERPEPLAAFERFLAELCDVPALLVLGDLFEFWIGAHQLRARGLAPLLAALSALVRGGTELHVLHGNRDFLLGPEFERATGARVHRSGVVGRLASGRRVLCLHGDELATRDRAYQRLRTVLRSAPVRALARSVPGSWSDAAARRLRRTSTRAVAAKPGGVVELQLDAAAEWSARQRAGVLVCGHAHRHRRERLPGGGEWIVLDAFGGTRDVLVCAADALRLRGDPLAAE